MVVEGVAFSRQVAVAGSKGRPVKVRRSDTSSSAGIASIVRRLANQAC